ncbi:MAG: hypothetical protein ACE5F7_10075 [Nitrospiria bacterium]
MPFIHIKSLPFKKSLDVSDILLGITRDFAEHTGVKANHIHTTWEFFSPGHYAKGRQAPEDQREAHHPVIVDLLTPDFNDMTVIALMLETIAESLSKRADFPKNNIFINHRQARSGMVFDDGEIVRW